MKTLIALLIAIKVLSPEFSEVISSERPRVITLINPVAEKVIGTSQPRHLREFRRTLLDDRFYEPQVSIITPFSEFLPDVRIEYKDITIYVDFIFRTILFQEKTGYFQYLQLTTEGNMRVLEIITDLFPDDDFLKVILEAERLRVKQKEET